jgi:hypothetical protein
MVIEAMIEAEKSLKKQSSRGVDAPGQEKPAPADAARVLRS